MCRNENASPTPIAPSLFFPAANSGGGRRRRRRLRVVKGKKKKRKEGRKRDIRRAAERKGTWIEGARRARRSPSSVDPLHNLGFRRIGFGIKGRECHSPFRGGRHGEINKQTNKGFIHRRPPPPHRARCYCEVILVILSFLAVATVLAPSACFATPPRALSICGRANK